LADLRYFLFVLIAANGGLLNSKLKIKN